MKMHKLKMHKVLKASSEFLIFFLTIHAFRGLQAQAPLEDSPAIEHQVDTMLGKMSLGQKIDLIAGEDDFFIRAAPEAGFPRLKMSDGPVGVRTWGPTTAYAAGVALAASWDPVLGRRIGVALGRDARSRGVNFLLGPGVNICRAPMDGRNFEYLGEDPYLASQLAVSYIDGLQSQGVVATVKHFVANNSEFYRHILDSVVDERTLHEIYLPAFEAAVKQGNVGAVMDSYNLVNGEHMTQNKPLDTDVLKKDWGFKGILMSDWGATYNGVAAANAGLDLEMARPEFMNRQTLLPAVQQGKVSEAVIDDKVRRIFRTAIEFGFLNRNQEDLAIPRYSQEGKRVALDGALESMVLLKNEGDLLPLDSNKIHTIAVIGPDARPAVPGGGGSSNATPFAAVDFVTGLSDALAGKVKVVYARGLPAAEKVFDDTVFDSGLQEEVFSSPDFTGNPVTRTIGSIRDSMRNSHLKSSQSVRWTGAYTPAKSGEFLFLVSAEGNDVYKLAVDGKTLIQETQHEGQAAKSEQLFLEAGKPIRFQLNYQPNSSSNKIGFGIRAVEDLVTPEARKLASAADVAFVSVGFDPSTEAEGFDRTFELPWGQDTLIQAIAAANPKTIVAITAGGNVAMEPWIAKVPAVIHNWYPGQEGGVAMSEILLGERSPEGKLPVSFAKVWSDNPVHDNYYPAGYPTRPAPGVTPQVKYAEGVFLGYRYYTTTGKKPLFPFGFGLSYTTFSFSNLHISPDRIRPNNPVTVSFDITNTGKRAGAEVGELYIGDPSARVKRPAMELKGFQKVRLAPGQTRHVTLPLNFRSFAYWDVRSHNWQVDPGRFTVFAGDSSENTPLRADLDITQ